MAKDEPVGPRTLSRMPSLLDRELTQRLRDAFGHAQFADALRDLIEADAKPPFSIGLLGPWGTGKSTIKSLYLEDLRDDKSRRDGKTRADRIFPITFNAWRHGGEEDLKRALLRAAFLQLSGDEAELNRELLHQVSKTAQIRRTWKEILFDAFGQLSVGLVIIAILFLLVTIALYSFLSKLGVVNVFSVVTFILAAAALTERLAKHLLDMRGASRLYATNYNYLPVALGRGIRVPADAAGSDFPTGQEEGHREAGSFRRRS